MASNRDLTIDTLRGLAVFTMVAANMTPDVLIEPHPFWLRLYGSFAAPLFILLSGMMVAFTTQTREHRLRYFMFRGAIIITIGMAVDLIYLIYPFTSVDVLYLIGLSLPLVYLFLRLNTSSRWIMVCSIFLITPIIQKALGYTDFPTEISFWGEQTITAENQTNIFNHWVVDGWFPIFPWLGFSFLGANLAHLRCTYKPLATFGKKSILLIGMGILAFGSILWYLFPDSLLTRGGNSELFYPPTIGYIITAIGIMVILFSIVDWKPSLAIYKPLRTLGESSLFIYWLHLQLIGYAIAPVWSKKGLQTFSLIYIGLLGFLILVAYGLRVLKAKWKDRPLIFRILLGG